jgi:hypothetical protein
MSAALLHDTHQGFITCYWIPREAFLMASEFLQAVIAANRREAAMEKPRKAENAVGTRGNLSLLD